LTSKAFNSIYRVCLFFVNLNSLVKRNGQDLRLQMRFESEADFPELLHLIKNAFKRNYNI
jgi:hypothetical protein